MALDMNMIQLSLRAEHGIFFKAKKKKRQNPNNPYILQKKRRNNIVQKMFQKYLMFNMS